ncbi:purine nucleoside permease-domain-containing protein [Chaetomium fimeti]|uniref:Purine nucleoside permease-domain-containing protein n=1 Tax=Chaetomium fimeti TaxID=1854472 RepID=A0AAE0HAA0_9PEZI|nr:purine nucleoside permease-domain-containing protein [Chaetomium fimeti]
MRPLRWMAAAILALWYLGLASGGVIQRNDIIKPKIIIISMVNKHTSTSLHLPRPPTSRTRLTHPPTTSSPPKPKSGITTSRQPPHNQPPTPPLGDLLALNITLPALSMIHPTVHCTFTGEICQLTTGEGKINAAAILTALTLSPQFDLRQSYFLVAVISGIAGVAGVNPAAERRWAAWRWCGSPCRWRYKHEFGAREMPAGLETDYVCGVWARGAVCVSGDSVYGTEVMEVNGALRDRAFEFQLRGGGFGGTSVCGGGWGAEVVKCDTATSDRITEAQEDNVTLEVLVRMAVHGLVDRSNFDRPAPDVTPYDHLLGRHQNGFDIAIENIFRAGIEAVKRILEDRDGLFLKGIPAPNYIWKDGRRGWFDASTKGPVVVVVG